MNSIIEQSELIAICPDPVIGVRPDGIISVFNPAAERLLGFSAGQVVDKMNIKAIYPGQQEAREIMRMLLGDDMGGSGRLEGYETSVVSSAGIRIPIRLSAALLNDGDARRGSIGFFHDMTQQKLLEATLKKQSITDDLSGLYNQRHFYAQVGREMTRTKRYGGELSLICIDLDGFKLLNDQLGHLEGDKIVRIIGQLLEQCTRDSDQAFRYGGDEFMVLLPNTSPESARAMADRIRSSFNLECKYSPEYIDENGVLVSMSLGIATTRGEEPVDHFIQQADMAMYRAKQSGGNAAKVFRAGAD